MPHPGEDDWLYGMDSEIFCLEIWRLCKIISGYGEMGKHSL